MEYESPRKSYYAIIPANVRYDKNLTPNAKLLYGEITALCNEKGYCWAENKYFADLYGVSKTSISKWIKSLIDGGYINSRMIYKEGTKEIDKRYITIVQYPIEEKLNTPIEEKLKDNNTLSNNTSNNIKERKKETEKPYSENPNMEKQDTQKQGVENMGVVKKGKGSFDTLIDEYCKTVDPLKADEIKVLLQDWLKVRKAKRAALTDKAIELNLKKLNEYAKESNMTVETYLEEVIMRGWQAFYPIKEYGAGAGKQGEKKTVRNNPFLEIAKERGLL